MNANPLTLTEAVERALLFESLRKAARKQDTRTPDALGDRMLRCVARYHHNQTQHEPTAPLQLALIEEAKKLLKGPAE